VTSLHLISVTQGRPESKATIFSPVRKVAALVGRQTTLFGRDRQSAALRGFVILSAIAELLVVFCFHPIITNFNI